MQTLNHYTAAIAKIFVEEKDRHHAHKKASVILAEMVTNREVLYDIYRNNLIKPDFISKMRHYPTLAFEIYLDKNVGMNANVFMPLPDKNTGISFQSIHHHGKLLLSTVAAEGPGYESILFKKGYAIDTASQTASMEIEKYYQFKKGTLEFIGSDQPHVVFFPEDVSITYTIWAYEKTVGVVQSLKDNAVVRKFKEPIRALLNWMNLSKKMGINVIENLDFYPEDGRIKVLKNRIDFKHGDNENFLINVFHVLQKTGFKDVDFLNNLLKIHPQNKYLLGLVNKLISGEGIGSPFYDYHKNVAYVNLDKDEILGIFKPTQNNL